MPALVISLELNISFNMYLKRLVLQHKSPWNVKLTQWTKQTSNDWLRESCLLIRNYERCSCGPCIMIKNKIDCTKSTVLWHVTHYASEVRYWCFRRAEEIRRARRKFSTKCWLRYYVASYSKVHQSSNSQPSELQIPNQIHSSIHK
jgi:hypothetical protein